MIKVSYVDHLGDDLRVVNSARISLGNQKEILDEKDQKLITFLAKNHHMSPFEHNILTIIVECPLYIRSQIHRHRTFSFNETSRRYTSEDLEMYEPTEYRLQSKINRQASEGILEKEDQIEANKLVSKLHEESLTCYNKLLELGVAREQARGVLPQNLMTKFYMTGNLRNWVHFLNLRLDPHSQGEVREIAASIKNILLEKFPISAKALLYDQKTI